MQKTYVMSALFASLAALSSCGGETKQEPAAPAEAPTAWSVEMTYLSNEQAKSKEVTNYGENNEIVSVDKYNISKESGQAVLTDHIIYENGKPSYSNVFETDGTVIGHSKFSYNEAGNITSEVIETLDPALKRIEASKRYVYEYDANGDVTLVKEQNAVKGGWANDYEWQYSYDDQHRLTSREDYNYNGKDRKQSCQYLYTYKAGTNQLDVVDYFFFDLKTNRLRHDSKTHYAYDKNGRVKTETVERHKANAKRDLINSRLITYNYNEAGQIADRAEQRWSSGEKKWQPVSKSKTYEYSESGQLLGNLESYNTNKGLRINKEIYTAVPEGRTLVAPAAQVEPIKPELNLDDKHKTDKNEED